MLLGTRPYLASLRTTSYTLMLMQIMEGGQAAATVSDCLGGPDSHKAQACNVRLGFSLPWSTGMLAAGALPATEVFKQPVLGGRCAVHTAEPGSLGISHVHS